MDHRPESKTVNPLEDNMGENLDDLGFGDDFLDTQQRQDPWKI